MKEPRVNVNLVDDSIHQFDAAHISVAIATDEGLYPATVRNADALRQQRSLQRPLHWQTKPRRGKLTKDDISGGSFTVSQSRDVRHHPVHRHYQPADGRYSGHG